MSTSSTLDSKKRALVLIAMAITVSCYVLLNAGLIGLSQWSERNWGSFPYRYEDWLRYQLGSYFSHADRDDILVVGASAGRENFLTHLIDPTTPDSKIILGAMSQGTLEDTVLGLEYLEQVYGSDHVPGTIVLGITARSVAGINNNRSPFQISLHTYSPYFKPSKENNETKLREKTFLEGLRGRWLFWFKQPQRYKTTVCAMSSYLLGGKNDPHELFSQTENTQALSGLIELQPDQISESLRVIRKLGFLKSMSLSMQLYSMPYKNHHRPPLTERKIKLWLDSTGSLISQAHRWNPDDNKDHVDQLFQRLLEFIRRNDSKLLVINMPEHPLSIERYKDRNYDRYMEIVQNGIKEFPLLDLRDTLTQDEFHDVIHATATGATNLTEQVNQFILQERRVVRGELTYDGT